MEVHSLETPPTTPAKVVKLPGAITIDDVKSLKSDITELDFTAFSGLELDASATGTITTPAAQLLLSLAKKLDNSGKVLTISNASENFGRTFSMLGLSGHYDQWRKHNA